MEILREFPSIERVTAARRKLEAASTQDNPSQRANARRFAGRIITLPEIESPESDNHDHAETEPELALPRSSL